MDPSPNKSMKKDSELTSTKVTNTDLSECKPLNIATAVSQISLIVQLMLDYIRYSQLCSLRLVSRMFRDLVTDEIHRRQNFSTHFRTRIELSCDPSVNTNQFIRTPKLTPQSKGSLDAQPIRPLSNLVQCMSASAQFPSLSFYFDGRKITSSLESYRQSIACGDLLWPDIQQLFSLHGQQIKFLLIIACKNMNRKTLWQILNFQVPYLEQLYLHQTSKENDSAGPSRQLTSDDEPVMPFDLPYLTAYSMPDSPEIDLDFFKLIVDILKGAPNLKIVYGCSMNYHMDILEQSGRHPWIYDHIVNVKTIDFIKFDRFCYGLSKLNRLTLSSGPVELANQKRVSLALNNLLNSIKDTLKKFVGPFGFFPHVKFPQFTNLSKLTLTEPYNENRRIFPPNTDLNHVFPALKTVLMKFQLKSFNENEMRSENIWDSYFPPSDPFRSGCDSVENLIVEITIPFWTSRFHKLFPNVREIRLEFFGRRECFEFLDEDFTGIPNLKCKDLAKMENLDELGRSEIDKMRTKISICNFERLRTLEINFANFGLQSARKFEIGFSQASYFCAFKLMPHLTVKFVNPTNISQEMENILWKMDSNVWIKEWDVFVK